MGLQGVEKKGEKSRKKVLTSGRRCDNINKLSAGNPVSRKYFLKLLKRIEKRLDKRGGDVVG